MLKREKYEVLKFILGNFFSKSSSYGEFKKRVKESNIYNEIKSLLEECDIVFLDEFIELEWQFFIQDNICNTTEKLKKRIQMKKCLTEEINRKITNQFFKYPKFSKDLMLIPSKDYIEERLFDNIYEKRKLKETFEFDGFNAYFSKVKINDREVLSLVIS